MKKSIIAIAFLVSVLSYGQTNISANNIKATGNISATGTVTGSNIPGSIPGAGTCVNQFVRILNNGLPPTCATVGSADLAASLALVTPSIGAATGTSIALSGAFTASSISNICIADLQAGADLGAKINTCIANGKEIWITQSGTISTQVLIQNLDSIYIRCLSWAGGPFGLAITDGITGSPAQPPILIKATGSVGGFIRISGCNLVGGSTTGNLVSIVGSGSNPAFIELDHNTFGNSTGNGIDSTGSSMSAAGVYAQGSLDLNIHDNDMAANVQGVVLDSGVNVAHIARNSINGNTLHGISATLAEHVEIGPNNDIENNATLTTDTSISMKGCIHLCSIYKNWIEGNNGFILLSNSGGVSGQFQVYENTVTHNTSVANPSSVQIIDTDGNGTYSIRNNYFTTNLNLNRFIDFNPSSNASATKSIYENTFEMFTGNSVSQAALFWQSGTNKSPIVIEGNNFGSINTGVFNGASGVEISAASTNARISNNSCYTNSGTLTNCIKVDSGATGIVIQGTLVSGTGTITNTINDAGTSTVCMGAGCPFPASIGGLKVSVVVGSGTASMTTAAIASGACGTTVTVAATGVVTTDVISVTRNAAATNANGGNLNLNAWPTSGNVNFNYCNQSAGSVTPTAMTVNWSVTR